jgi:hypothetical protein
MGLANDFEAAILAHIFDNTDVALVGDAPGLIGSTVAGSLYVALHTAEPGAGDQTTSEATYTGYARKAVTRTAGKWLRAGTDPLKISNAASVTFDPCTDGSNTVTHFSVGVASAGASMMLIKGELIQPMSVINGVTPTFAADTLISNYRRSGLLWVRRG